MDNPFARRVARLILVAILLSILQGLPLSAVLARGAPPPIVIAWTPTCSGNALANLRIAQAWSWTLCHDQGPSCEWQVNRQSIVWALETVVACAGL